MPVVAADWIRILPRIKDYDKRPFSCQEGCPLHAMGQKVAGEGARSVRGANRRTRHLTFPVPVKCGIRK